jgi:hypothetical protein
LGNISKTIGSYLEDLNKIELKMKGLVGKFRSGIKVQVFIFPIICALIASLSILILDMLKTVSCQLTQKSILDFINVMPMSVFQVIVGIFTIEIVTLLTILLNGIENGFDNVSRDYLVSKNLMKAIIIYIIVSVVVLFLFQENVISIIETGIGFTCD